MFHDNTADLTTDGARCLTELARHLTSRTDSGVIEIHAQTAASDPTPFHFILTQARAEVVRDFLIHEGVHNFRFMTKAMSSENEDSTAAKAQVRLLLRSQ
jgi:outer membrane protein OmpA-like peptidoglycan-associated protein